MKGFRTVAFNLIMLIAGVTGNELAPEVAHQYVEWFLGAWAAGNVILRWITDSPIFRGR